MIEWIETNLPNVYRIGWKERILGQMPFQQRFI